MVGYMGFLRMLHCKMQHKKALSKNGDTRTNPNIKVKVRQDLEEPDVLQLYYCRVCLKYGDIPIFGNDSEDDLSDALSIIGGIDVSQDDMHSKYLCESCNSLLRGAILFRETAQKSNEILKQQKQQKTNETRSIPDDPTYNNDNDCFEYEEENDNDRELTYNCKKCDLNFKTFNEYHEHRLSLEHENFRRTCPICKNSYTSLYFKKHLALHKLDPKYMCDICGKKFTVQGQFSRHRLIHFNYFPFKCSLCPYKGRFNESLKMHMRTHTGEKPYQCSSCPSRFVNKSNLNKHLLTHKKDHDYKCEMCDRGFYTKQQMELHLKVDHTGIKDHVCDLCGKAFGYRKQMMKHQLKVHKREKFQSGRMPLYMQVESKSQ